MDAYQQQPHRYLRPPPPQPPQPPPPTMDPHHQFHHQYAQPPRPPTPQPSYYPNQFQYQHHQSHSSPSPPPPPPAQWGPPPPPPTVPYPGHPHGAAAGNHFSPHPSRPHLPPPQIPHSYPQVNQEWSNPNWSYHHGWDYSAHNNVEDWGAKAREWANARAAMQEQQQPQSQFTTMARPEDQNRFHDQYQQAVDTHYQDGQQQSLPTLNYQQFPASAASPHVPPMMYPQESLSGHQTYQVKDGTSAADSTAGFLHQESLPTASSIHQQEVPSSYSSVSEKEDSSVSSAQESQQLQTSVPAAGRSGTIEPSFTYGSQAVDPAGDLSDRPLDFAPRFNEHDSHIHSSFTAHHESVGVGRGIDPVTAVPSINAWTPPVAPPVVYPPIPPVLPLGVQHDPSMALTSLSGHAAPPFGRFPGPNYQPTIPTASASFDLGTGAPLHPSVAFPGDTYGGVSDRPKKAPVPNWLKEEIIKNKAAIAKSSLEHPKEETQSIEDEGVDKSFGKGDQADSKSVDSSRSTEEEDDDEDYVEAARTAAINQEIKRVLTEVLLKVTDELFDEIATKVLSEDDLAVEVNHNNLNSRPSPPAVPTAKASARVVVPGKGKESDGVGLSEKSNSSFPGDVLGLGSYASDDDDDDETQSSIPASRNNSILQPSSSKRLSENMLDAAENGNFHRESNEYFRSEKNSGSDLIQLKENKKAAVAGLGENGADRVHEHSYSSRMVSRNEINTNSEKPLDGNNGSLLNDTLGEKIMATSELPAKDTGKKSRKDDSQGRESGLKSEKDDCHENRKSSGKDSGREVEISRVREDEKGDENRRRQDERHLRKEKADDRNVLKEHGVKAGNKAKESESQRRSNHLDAKDERKDAERSHRAGAKEEVDRKREQTKEGDRARHKLGSDSSRHKRRRSSSPSSRGRSSKDNSGSHANDSSDEVSDDSKRKLHTRKRNSSPSPVRSRRRQVSRSPHSKHSQRRHSPYPSLDSTSTRGRRSRSRSPARRQR